jgi:hypothetical protein
MLFPGSDNWRAGMQDVSAAIDETMGELVLVTPATVPAINFPSVADPSKAVKVIAVFTSRAKAVILGNEGKMGGHSVSVNPLVSTSEPIFQFSYGVLRTMPFPIRQGYRITRLCSGETFEVTDVKPDSVSRTCVHVVQLGRQLESR